MSRVQGVVDLSLEQQMDIPFVRFVLNRPAIARQGLRAEDVAPKAVEASFAGATVGRSSDRGAAFGRRQSSISQQRRLSGSPSADRHAGGSTPVPIRLLAESGEEGRT